MSEYGDLLERARREFTTPDLPLETVVRRRDRKRRDGRIAAGAVVLLIALGAVAAGVSTFRSPPTSAPLNHPPAPMVHATHNGDILLSLDQGLSTIDPGTGALAGLTIGPSCCGDGEIYDTDWSPDGTRVAYIKDCVACPRVDAVGLFVAPVRGPFYATQIVSGIGPTTVRWSPDGTRIAYVMMDEEEEVGHLVISYPDGTNAQTIALGPLSATSVAWSPDGSHIAVGVERFGGASTGVEIVDTADPQVHRRLESNGSLPAWSPDGSQIVSREGCSIWSAPAEGGTSPVRIADLGDVASTQGTGCGDPFSSFGEPLGQPRFSPDGRFLVVNAPGGGVAIMRADGSDLHVVAPNRTGMWGPPAWQPIP